jgi:hypothetical protein
VKTARWRAPRCHLRFRLLRQQLHCNRCRGNRARPRGASCRSPVRPRQAVCKQRSCTSTIATRIISTIPRMLLVAKNGSVSVQPAISSTGKRIPCRGLQALWFRHPHHCLLLTGIFLALRPLMGTPPSIHPPGRRARRCPVELSIAALRLVPIGKCRPPAQKGAAATE